MERRDELVSAVTHLLGAVFSVGIAATLIVFASLWGSVWHIVSFSLFGASLILLYGASSAYHLSISRRTRALLRRLDHAMIFVLIAGTYTPLLLTAIRGGWGWSLFGVVWGIALGGMFWKLSAEDLDHPFSTMLYILAGWLVVVAALPLFETLSAVELFWLVLGGACYTLGACFLAFRRLPVLHPLFSPHNAFHFFVILGSGSHAWMTLHLLW